MPGADFAEPTIVVAAGSWTVARFFDGNLSCELEAQVDKYFGDQDHWEFNLPIIVFRWHRFPWDRYVATSFAWGIGTVAEDGGSNAVCGGIRYRF